MYWSSTHHPRISWSSICRPAVSRPCWTPISSAIKLTLSIFSPKSEQAIISLISSNCSPDSILHPSMMTQPAPRRALVDLDNIEFYRPQPSKSLPPESALSIPLTLPPLSILPVAATRKALPRGDGALLFDRPYGWDSSCDPEVLNSFDVELARCANAASLATRSHTDSELTQGETGNETVGASTFALTSSPSLSSREETTDPPGPFESTASREIIEIPTEPDGHVCPPSPDVQERDQPPDIQPCGLHDEPSVSNGRCSSIPHHDNHGMTECRTPSSHVPNNDIANKPLGERETDQVLLGDGLPQPKQIISIPALSEEDPLLNDQRLPLIGVADSGPEDQLHSDSGNSFLAESKKTSVHERCPMPHRLVAGVTTSPETPSTITKPPRRKSFEVAQARIVERRNRPRRNCQPGFNVVLRDCHPGCSDREESSRPTKRRKRAPRPVGKVTNCISSGPLGKSLHSSASAQSAKACHSQDIFGHAVLTVETHALGTSFFFSFEPNSPNQLDAPQFRFSLDEPRRLTAPSSMRGSKSVQGSKTGRLPLENDIHTTVTFNTLDEREWEVEHILASRVRRGKLQYQARWKGCDSDPTWYPARGFKGAPYKIQNFHGVFPDQPGPPKRLTEWLEGWEAGQELEDVPDDDLPE